jgi:NAD(P)H-dependent FMN reductase
LRESGAPTSMRRVNVTSTRSILGLVGSSRRLGNTDVLVTEVARAAAVEDAASVRLLRLSDLRLLACTGCMACAFQDGGACPLEDDMEFVLAEMQAAQALILGAPAYGLLPPAPVKAWADRFLMALGRQKTSALKPAVVVGVAGLADWSRQLLPALNGLVMAFGYRLVDSLIAYAPGPGEVLLDPANVPELRNRALSGVRRRLLPFHCRRPRVPGVRCRRAARRGRPGLPAVAREPLGASRAQSALPRLDPRHGSCLSQAATRDQAPATRLPRVPELVDRTAHPLISRDGKTPWPKVLCPAESTVPSRAGVSEPGI